MEDKGKKDLEKSGSKKNRRIIVGVCGASMLIALALGLCVGFAGRGAINGGDTTSVSSNSGISSETNSNASSKSSEMTSSSNGDDSSSSSSSKGDDKSSSSNSQSGNQSSSSSSSYSDGDSSSSSSGSSQGGDISSSSSSSSSTHTHTFGTTLEVITEATASKAGTKGYKCTECGAVDTEHTVEYSPFMDSFDWDKALFGDSALADNEIDYSSHATDYTLKIDSFEYSGSSEIKDHYINTSYQKYGNIVHKNNKSYTSSLSIASKEDSSYEFLENYFQIMDDGKFYNYNRSDENNAFKLRTSDPGYDDFRERGGEFNLRNLNDSVFATRTKFAKENFQYDATKGTYSSSFSDFTPVEYEGALSGTIVLGFDEGKLVSLDYSYTCSVRTGFNYEVKASVVYSAGELAIPTNITK